MRCRFAVLLILGSLVACAMTFATSIPITVNCTNGVQQGFNAIAVVDCRVPGGGSYTGIVKAVAGDDFLKLILTKGFFVGDDTGKTPFAISPYFFAGEGVLRSFLDGRLVGGATSIGGEFFNISADARSFSNTPAPTFWMGPAAGTVLPVNVTGMRTNEGIYLGSGNLNLFLQYHIPEGERVTFSSSGFGLAAVPEPSSLLLLGTGLVGLVPLLRRKLRM